MVKKMVKYSKFVLCIALILSLVAPSYAALSASDGSAFVTKAEFDSALADFNARLTTFEAGINSKIDSQVTSYLDRNGIWNGKDVTASPLLNSPDSGRIDWPLSLDSHKWFGSYDNGSNGRSYTEFNGEKFAWEIPFAYVPKKFDFIQTVPKSGLLTGYVYLRNAGSWSISRNDYTTSSSYKKSWERAVTDWSTNGYPSYADALMSCVDTGDVSDHYWCWSTDAKDVALGEKPRTVFQNMELIDDSNSDEVIWRQNIFTFILPYIKGHTTGTTGDAGNTNMVLPPYETPVKLFIQTFVVSGHIIKMAVSWQCSGRDSSMHVYLAGYTSTYPGHYCTYLSASDLKIY